MKAARGASECRPFRAWGVVGVVFPGRCPGLSHFAASRLKPERRPAEPACSGWGNGCLAPGEDTTCCRRRPCGATGDFRLGHRYLAPFVGHPAFARSTPGIKNPPAGLGGFLFPAMTYSLTFRQYHRRAGLNCRVRNGNGCFPCTMDTGKLGRSCQLSVVGYQLSGALAAADD